MNCPLRLPAVTTVVQNVCIRWGPFPTHAWDHSDCGQQANTQTEPNQQTLQRTRALPGPAARPRFRPGNAQSKKEIVGTNAAPPAPATSRAMALPRTVARSRSGSINFRRPWYRPAGPNSTLFQFVRRTPSKSRDRARARNATPRCMRRPVFSLVHVENTAVLGTMFQFVRRHHVELSSSAEIHHTL